jgi:hypothetical protein
VPITSSISGARRMVLWLEHDRPDVELVIKNASGRFLIIAAKALSNSSELRTARGRSLMPKPVSPLATATKAGLGRPCKGDDVGLFMTD